MIGHPRGWTRLALADGTLLVPPGGLEAGAVRYRERVRPLRRLGELIETVAARGLTSARLVATEELLTLEGEHAAVARVGGLLHGVPAQRDLGVVFGDDHLALLDGTCHLEEHFAAFSQAVRDLVLTDSHALGVRRRRYRYRPPADWQPVVRGFITDWIPPFYPRDAATLTVYAANPLPPSWTGGLERLLAGAAAHELEVTDTRGFTAIESRAGLTGTAIEVVGRHRGERALRSVASLWDDRYLYSMELVSRSPPRWDEHLAALAGVVASVVPAPRPTALGDEERVVRPFLC